MKRIITVLALLVLFVGLTAVTHQAQAQSDEGLVYISGLVYEDTNGDGRCLDTGESPLADMPIVLSPVNSDDTFYHRSGADGRYQADGLRWGSWEVTLAPSSGYVVTSDNPLNVFVHNTEAGKDSVNFCVSKSDAVTVLLPVSGSQSPMPLVLMAVAVLGFGFIVAGSVKISRKGS
jgi:hypothetical protein